MSIIDISSWAIVLLFVFGIVVFAIYGVVTLADCILETIGDEDDDAGTRTGNNR